MTRRRPSTRSARQERARKGFGKTELDAWRFMIATAARPSEALHCRWPALLLRAEWIVPKGRRRLVHEHPNFVGAVMLTARPRWVERAQDSASPRHNFAWGVWGATPRVGDDPWLRFAGRETAMSGSAPP